MLQGRANDLGKNGVDDHNATRISWDEADKLRSLTMG